MSSTSLIDAPPEVIPDRRPGARPDQPLPFRVDVRHAVAALVVGALVAVALAVIVGAEEQAYESRAVLTIDQPRAIAAGDGGGVVEKLSVLRGKYAGLLRTNVIAEPVADRTGATVGEARRSLAAEIDSTSLLMTIRARAGDAESAELLAAAAADELVRYADEEQASFDIPEGQRFAFEVVVPAEGGASVASPRGRQLRLAAIGFVVAAALAYAALQLLTAERRS